MGLAVGCKEAKNLAVTRKKKCFLLTICHFERFQVTVAQKRPKFWLLAIKAITTLRPSRNLEAALYADSR